MKWRSLEEQKTEQFSRSLRDIYAERKELITKYVPADVQAVHARVVADLRQTGIAEHALQPGSAAPQFELPDANSRLIRSLDLLQRGPLVICFIRGRWCPFCVGQMEAMNAAYPEIQKPGASMIAISPQTVHQSFLMADQYHLQFPLLSDAGNKVARQFGLVYRVPEDQEEIYRRSFVNLPSINGDSSWELPIPATYVIGNRTADRHALSAVEGSVCPTANHLILYASANPDYTKRPEPAEIIHTLAQLLS